MTAATKSMDERCNCDPGERCGCCESAPQSPAAPLVVENVPGLAAIRYRIGTFTSFRRAMLDELTNRIATNPNHPFKFWRESDPAHPLLDYQTMFIELWSYLADVLTFYQERIANEAFLQTATQRDSLLRLCRLIDYQPSPGSGAGGLLAFTVEKNKTVEVPESFRAGNKPAPGVEQAVFETESPIIASGAYSAIPLASTTPMNQFAELQDYSAILSLDGKSVDAAKRVYPNSADKIMATLRNAISASTKFRSRMADPRRIVVLKGINNRVAVGNHVMLEHERADGTREQKLFKLDAVQIDKSSNSTTIVLSGDDIDKAYDKVALFAFRVTATPFGSDAPNWDTLAPMFKVQINGFPPPPYKDKSWEPGNLSAKLTTDNSIQGGNTLFLNDQYDIEVPPSSLVWAIPPAGTIGSDGNPTRPRCFIADGAETTSVANYTMQRKVTAIHVQPQIIAGQFPLRTTTVLTGAEELLLHGDMPLPEFVWGDTLVLAGCYDKLKKNQTIVVRGPRWVAESATIEEGVAEEATIKEAPKFDDQKTLTFILLTAALKYVYVRASTSVLANVVRATQGETIKDEVLGSGDGSAFQSFTLKKKPLTHLPGADPQGPSSLRDTLRVTVNGELWTERPTLAGSSPDAQEYSTSIDDANQTTIHFGDGINGARPAKGKDNIRARYRRGMGFNGNVLADNVAQLLDSRPGLQKVTNPLSTIGGLDRESNGQIRINAPASLRTFGRAVSVEDYTGLALTFPGVAKASTTWIVRHPATRRGTIAQPFVQLTIVPADGKDLQEGFARRLREFLDARRDPNVPLRVVGANRVPIVVEVDIYVDDRFGRNATMAAVLAALIGRNDLPGFFSLSRQQLGQSVRLSELYGAIHTVPGVSSVLVNKFRRADSASPKDAPVPEEILLTSQEIAELKNPDDAGKDLINYKDGGFVDT